MYLSYSENKHCNQRSHCMNCNTKLKCMMIPVFSYISTGKCRSYKSRISIQYPISEALGIMYVLVLFLWIGFSVFHLSILLSTVSALIVLA